MDFNNEKLIEIPRPELGRPTDPRLTQEYIAAHPALARAGYPSFDPERDVDYHGYIQGALQWLHAQIQYANPELAGQLTTLKGELESGLADNQRLQAESTRLSREAAQTAARLQAIYDVAGLQQALITQETALLTVSGYAVGLSAGGERTLRVSASGPLGLRTNPDGSTTVYGDPALFAARTNPDGSTTLYRR